MTARARLASSRRVEITPFRAHRITDTLYCAAAGRITSVSLGFQIEHTDVSDLRIHLRTPWGEMLPLILRRGRRGNPGFPAAVISDEAGKAASEARFPWRLPMRPEAPLLPKLAGRPAAGSWELVIDDVRAKDGGALQSWWIELGLRPEFAIELECAGLTSEQRSIAEAAAESWSQRIVEALPNAILPGGRRVQDTLIWLRLEPIDGAGKILGHAGPTHIRWDSSIPIAGQITLDEADAELLHDRGALGAVIDHEIAHCLGFGVLWQAKGLLEGAGSEDPRFIGEKAKAAYAEMGRAEDAKSGVPVETRGGPGTRDVHWRTMPFVTELMTGWLTGAQQPFSAVSLAAFADFGFGVNPHAADYYGFGAHARTAERPESERRQCVVPLADPIRVKP